MSYESAPATILLATTCAACGKSLVDADSVETGIGPDCRKRHGYGKPDLDARWGGVALALTAAGLEGLVNEGDARATANHIVHRIACDTLPTESRLRAVLALSELGYVRLAAKCARAKSVSVEVEGEDFVVKAPFNPAFNDACRGVPGARWDRDRKVRTVPVTSKAALWQAIKATFPPETVVVGTRLALL
jgi:hypothetical protein